MAHGSDNQLDSQPESQVSNPGDAAMANTAAQSYSGGEFQSMSQGAYAQSAKDSQDMSKGPNATLGDLQITGANSTKASDAGMASAADSNKATDAGLQPGANPGNSSDAGTAPGTDLGKDANSSTKPEANSVSDANSGLPPGANGASDANSGLPPGANSASDAGVSAPPNINGASDANSGLPPSTSGDNSLAHSSGESNLHPGSSNSSSNGDAALHTSSASSGSGDATLHSSSASLNSGDAALHTSSASAANINAARSNEAALQNFDPKGDSSPNNPPELSRTTDHPGAATGNASAFNSNDAASANVNPNRERNFESWNGGQASEKQGATEGEKLGDSQGARLGDSQGDRQGDSTKSPESADRYGVPETKLPTPEQVKNAPVEQLQQMATESRKATEDYVAQQGNAIPHLGFHGTSEGSAKGITNRPQGEIWVAGAKPEMTAQGVSQHVQALSDSTRISQGHAESPRVGSNGGPGPVLVFNTNNQPEAWQKTSGESGNAKYGMLDLQKGDLLGQVSREQLDNSKKELEPLHGALNEKGAEYQKQPGGLTESHLDEIRARGQAVDSMHRDRELQMYLGVVAKSNSERSIGAQPEQTPANQSFFSRMVSRFRGNSW
jgi:hypothetical protein